MISRLFVNICIWINNNSTNLADSPCGRVIVDFDVVVAAGGCCWSEYLMNAVGTDGDGCKRSDEDVEVGGCKTGTADDETALVVAWELLLAVNIPASSPCRLLVTKG